MSSDDKWNERRHERRRQMSKILSDGWISPEGDRILVRLSESKDDYQLWRGVVEVKSTKYNVGSEVIFKSTNSIVIPWEQSLCIVEKPEESIVAVFHGGVG